MPPDPPRIAREKRTVRAMVAIYCRAHHGTGGELCTECSELLDYACARLDRCPFGVDKPACGKCPIHCYKPSMKAKAVTVMRYAGPRMLLKHPILALLHWLDALRRTPERPEK